MVVWKTMGKMGYIFQEEKTTTFTHVSMLSVVTLSVVLSVVNEALFLSIPGSTFLEICSAFFRYFSLLCWLYGMLKLCHMVVVVNF